jgi:hypothetical protein
MLRKLALPEIIVLHMGDDWFLLTRRAVVRLLELSRTPQIR